MQFENFFEAHAMLLWGAFLIALVMGMVVNKTNFCTMGAVSDYVNMGDSGRLRAWWLAIAVAVIGVSLFEYLGWADIDGAVPPYRSGVLRFGENILGGLLFGIGMTLASGCGNKCLIRIGGGNLKSVMVFAIIGTVAYFMINPFPGTDQTLLSLLFLDWIRPASVDVGERQDLGWLASAENAQHMRLGVGLLIGAAVILFVLRSAEFRGNRDNLLGGLVVGLAIVGGWYLSSNILVEADGETYRLGEYHEEWDMLADSDEGKPAAARPLSSQSYTFISPMGQSLGYLGSGLQSDRLTFGVVAVAGVILGSLLWSLLSRSFRLEWFHSRADVLSHVIGALLMGFGGVLAMGCTIGQAITGISTLAVGSMLTFGSIFLGSALTMKVQLYKMVYPDEASLSKALVTGLVDLKLLPSSLRKLDRV